MISRRIAARCVAVLLAATTALPVTAVSAEPASPGPAPAPESELVPGVPENPYRPWQIDTPDQMLAPKVYTPSAVEDAVERRNASEAGRHEIYWRHENHWSTLHNTPMPYAQFFSGGQAFHAVHGSIHTTRRLHGLREPAAR